MILERAIQETAKHCTQYTHAHTTCNYTGYGNLMIKGKRLSRVIFWFQKKTHTVFIYTYYSYYSDLSHVAIGLCPLGSPLDEESRVYEHPVNASSPHQTGQESKHLQS